MCAAGAQGAFRSVYVAQQYEVDSGSNRAGMLDDFAAAVAAAANSVAHKGNYRLVCHGARVKLTGGKHGATSWQLHVDVAELPLHSHI